MQEGLAENKRCEDCNELLEDKGWSADSLYNDRCMECHYERVKALGYDYNKR